jgi:hypothetical protein
MTTVALAYGDHGTNDPGQLMIGSESEAPRSVVAVRTSPLAPFGNDHSRH